MAFAHDRPTTNDGPPANQLTDEIALEVLETANATVVVEHGPAGAIARVDTSHDGFSRYYAGPLDITTLIALREVAQR